MPGLISADSYDVVNEWVLQLLRLRYLSPWFMLQRPVLCPPRW